MKNILLFSIISILVSSFSAKVFYLNKNRILLIQYDIETKIETINDYNKKKEKDHFLECFPAPSLNIAYYNSNKLYVFGTLKTTDSSKIILWTKDSIMNIVLPFHYEHALFDCFINDSVIQFVSNNHKQILMPGQVYNDSIISIEKNKRQYLKITTIYSISNHGLIFKSNIIDEDEETRIQDSIERYELDLLEQK